MAGLTSAYRGVDLSILYVDAGADLDGATGALAVDAVTRRLSLRPNGSDTSVGGPYVTACPVDTD